MPIYEYFCTNCHRQFDLLQKISEPPLEECPQCAYKTLTKLVSAPGFQLKGTGWYATDFKDKPKKEGSSKKEEPTKEAAVKEKAASPTTSTAPKESE